MVQYSMETNLSNKKYDKGVKRFANTNSSENY